MKLGFYTYSYIDRLKMEIEPVLEAVAAAGYDGIDISATWHDDLDPALMPGDVRDRYVKSAARLDLTIEACVTHLGLVQAVWNDQPLNLKGAIDVACDVGAKIVTVHIGSANGRPAEAWRTAVDYLKRTCDYAGERKVVIALDGVWPTTILDTPESVARMIDNVGSPYLKHNYDPSFLALSGHDLDDATRVLAPHIVHAHIKDHVGRYPTFEHRIGGEGELDHAHYIKLLHEFGFKGFVAHECFTDMPLDRACSVGYRTLSAAISASGAR